MIRFFSVFLAAFLSACQPSADHDANRTGAVATPAAAPELCESAATPIGEIQGEGFRSPVENQQATARGVVTHVIPGQGLFMQEEHPATFARVSHGIYIASSFLAVEISRGALLAVSGSVREIGEGDDTLTSLENIEQFANCGMGAEPPDIDARLPLSSAEREAFEGMRVMLEQPLTVTAVRDVPEGKIMVSALGMLRAPTEVALPGEAAAAQQRKNQDWSLVVHDNALSDLTPYTQIHAGALVHMLSGILAHDGEQLFLLATDDVLHVPLPVPEIDPPAEGTIRLASYNLYEYFNGDGQGGGFPGERGAESLAQFQDQAARIMATFEQIRPDVIGVMEIENDGFGPDSAIQDLNRSVSETLGNEFGVASADAGHVGTDVISVGLLYRKDRLEAIGPAAFLEGETFGPLNRVAIAQVLEDRASGERIVVVVNHLKSKGYCPDSGPDMDQGDGQACWNKARIEGAREAVAFAGRIAAENDTPHFLLVGDFNAYRMEDPVREMEALGVTELVAHLNPGLPQYSYIYQGAAGTLDYAFASESLVSRTTGAFIWHINAAYPYAAEPSQPWLRSSDHDPVVVDFSFSQSATLD